MGKIILMLVFLCSVTVHAATYYVSNSGNDSNSGLTSDLSWKTLAKVESSGINSGNTILFKCGDTWRESITLYESGISSTWIKLSNYGTGAKPRILGSEKATVWTDQGSNVWRTTMSIPASENVWIVNNDLSVIGGIKQSSLVAVTSDTYWYTDGTYIYLHSTSNPSTRYNSVEVPQRMTAITLYHKQYIEIDGIDMFYTDVCIYESTSPSANVNGLIVRNCELGYTGYPGGDGVGIHALYSNSLYEKNTIHDNGRRGMSFMLVTSDFNVQNVTVQNNHFYNGHHTTSIDLQASTGYTGGINNLFIKNNLIEESPSYATSAYSMLLYLSDQGEASPQMTNIYVTNNIFKYTSSAAINSEGIESLYIYNNTFYGSNEVGAGNTSFIFTSRSAVIVKNNIFYNQLAYDTNSSGLIYWNGNNTSFISDYNIFYRSTKAVKAFRLPSGDYTMADSTAIRNALGGETHSKFVDPKLKSPSDLSLQSVSKAINAGTNVGLTTDYINRPVQGLQDIGAYQFYIPEVLKFGRDGKIWRF